jgi:hypothetical protein
MVTHQGTSKKGCVCVYIYNRILTQITSFQETFSKFAHVSLFIFVYNKNVLSHREQNVCMLTYNLVMYVTTFIMYWSSNIPEATEHKIEYCRY